MIPKKIHYCWFGGKPLPELAKRCINSWEKYCPNFEIIRWDESNSDLNICPFVKEAYDAKMYAFVSDYIRLYALYNEGGIYMDTDEETIKPLDTFLSEKSNNITLLYEINNPTIIPKNTDTKENITTSDNKK